MKYYYDYENDCFLNSADLAEEFEKYRELDYTEAETVDQYISNVMDTGNVVEISAHVYAGRAEFYKVKTVLEAICAAITQVGELISLKTETHSS